jgi:hypothetical protein
MERPDPFDLKLFGWPGVPITVFVNKQRKMELFVVNDGVEPSPPCLAPVPTRERFQRSHTGGKERPCPILRSLDDYPGPQAKLRTFKELLVVLRDPCVPVSVDELSERSEVELKLFRIEPGP